METVAGTGKSLRDISVKGNRYGKQTIRVHLTNTHWPVNLLARTHWPIPYQLVMALVLFSS